MSRTHRSTASEEIQEGSSVSARTSSQSSIELEYEKETSQPEKNRVKDGDSLKILRVASDVYPEVMGGLSLHVHEMSRLQAEWGHDVTVLTSDHGDRELPSKEERDGYELIRHREVANPLDNTIVPGLVRTVWKMADDYDVIHAHSHLFFTTNVAAVFKRQDDTPLVVTNHGLISQTAPKWLQKAFIPTVARFTLNSADRILCYSETDERRLQERGIDTEVSVVHNGIDCETFAPMEVDDEPLQVLFVGRLKPGKGVDKLLIAFKDVLEEFPEATLKIVGDGPLRNDLEELAKERGICSSVEFADRIPNDEMPEVYAESDVFVLPSKNEGLPRTVLEAMACRTPVVTSSLPQLESVVNGAGLMVDSDSTEQFAEYTIQILENQAERKRMGETGREKVRLNYSWNETVRKTNMVYSELL